MPCLAMAGERSKKFFKGLKDHQKWVDLAIESLAGGSRAYRE